MQIQVYLKPKCSRGEASLSAHRDGSVDIKYTFLFANEQWRPFKNENGSWSFQSAHGTWLRARADGTVSLQTNLGADGQFWLESIEGKVFAS